MTLKVYRDDSANAIFIEDANGAQFLNSLQATVDTSGTCSINDTSKNIQITSNIPFAEYVDENDVQHGSDDLDTCNKLNAIFQSSGTNTTELPLITSTLAISSTEGEVVNYELIASYGVGYEWDLSNVPGITTVEGNPRKLIGGSGLIAGEYAIPVKAINYNGEDSQIIELSVGTPPFANTKSTQFDNNDYLGANAAILDNVLGRSSNGSGLSDAWSLSFWFKPGTATNASQTIFYFGAQDIANSGHMQLKYNGTLKRFEFRYGTSNNRLNFFTVTNGLTVGQWHHLLLTYDGGETGSSSADIDDYYDCFKFFVDGSNVTDSLLKSHNNFGYTGSIVGENLRIGRYNNGQSLRNNCLVDEVAVYNDDVSALISDIYNSGVAVDLMSLGTEPEHWWRMGDGDSYPYVFDVGFQANCIHIMTNMTAAAFVNDVPN